MFVIRSQLPALPVLALLCLCSGNAFAQVDVDRLRNLPVEAETDELLLLQPLTPNALPSVCEVIGDLPTRAIAGRVVEASGEVFVERLGRRLPRQRGDNIMDDDHIITNDNSYVRIRFIDSALVALSENSHMHLYAYWYERSPVVVTDDDCAAIELLQGGVRLITGDIARRDPNRFEILVHANNEFPRVAARSNEIVDMEIKVDARDGSVYTAVYSGGSRVTSQGDQLNLGVGAGFDFAEVSPDGDVQGLTRLPQQLQSPFLQR